MDTSNVSPVTESEVMDLAQRICTMIVGHSTQQSKIDSLTFDLDNVRVDFERAISECTKLRTDLKDSNDLARIYEDDIAQARRNHETEKGRAEHLQSLMLARDSKVAELSQRVNDNETTISTQRDTINQQESRINSLLQRNDSLVYENDSLSKRLGYMDSEWSKTKAALDKFKAVLGELDTKVDPPKPEQAKVVEQAQSIPDPVDTTVDPVPAQAKPSEIEKSWPHNY